MKELKDYIHLYIGCECIIGDLKWKPEKYLHGLAPGVDPNHGKPIRTILDAHVLNVYLHMTTLVLRPLSDMTEDEFLYMYRTQSGPVNISMMLDDVCKGFDCTPYQVAYMLSQGFDLFGLIDAGLAVSKTETKN